MKAVRSHSVCALSESTFPLLGWASPRHSSRALLHSCPAQHTLPSLVASTLTSLSGLAKKPTGKVAHCHPLMAKQDSRSPTFGTLGNLRLNLKNSTASILSLPQHGTYCLSLTLLGTPCLCSMPLLVPVPRLSPALSWTLSSLPLPHATCSSCVTQKQHHVGTIFLIFSEGPAEPLLLWTTS